MVPLDLSQTVPITSEIQQKMRAIGSPLSLTMSQLWDNASAKANGKPVNIHYAIGVLYIWRPDLFKGRQLRVDVETAS